MTSPKGAVHSLEKPPGEVYYSKEIFKKSVELKPGIAMYILAQMKHIL